MIWLIFLIHYSSWNWKYEIVCISLFRYLYWNSKLKRVKRLIQRQENEAKLDSHIKYGYQLFVNSLFHSTNSHSVPTRHCVGKWKYNDEKKSDPASPFEALMLKWRRRDIHSWNKLQIPPLYLMHHNKKVMWPVL